MATTARYGAPKVSTGQATKEQTINEAFDIFDAAIAGHPTGITQTAPFIPGARVYHNAAQSVATATLVALAMNSERYDTNVIHDTATNNSRLTCKTAGLYRITGQMAFAAAAAGIRQASIRLNGATYLASQTFASAGGADSTVIVVATDYFLAVNDYVELIAYQTSGGAINVSASANQSPEFMMARIG